MNSKGLEVFLALALTKSFQQAARMLNISQSAVSHRLKEFEQELGVELVERKRGYKTIDLTEKGENLLPLAMNWRQLHNELERFKDSFEFGESIAIGGLDSVKNHILLPFLQAFRLKYPELQIKLLTGSSSSTYDLVANREVDIGFVQFDINTRFVRVETFCREKFYAVSANRVLPKNIRPEQLAPENECTINWGYNFSKWHEAVWGVNRRPLTVCDTLFEMRGLLEASDTWAFIPASALQWFLGQGNFVSGAMESGPPDRVISMISNQEARKGVSRALSCFKSVLKDKGIRSGFKHEVEFVY